MNKIPIFRQFFILYVVTLAAAFLGYAAFGVEYPDPATGLRIIDNITGFVLGTVLGTAIAFVLGSSQESQDRVSQEQAPKKPAEGEVHTEETGEKDA